MKTILSSVILLTLSYTVLAEDSLSTGTVLDPHATSDIAHYRGKKLVFEYRHATVPFKPYIGQLYTPSGLQVLRDNVLDHKHHHGLMFAVAVDGVDFWSETASCGKQVTTTIEPTGKKIVAHLDWMAPDGKVLLKEVRTIIENSSDDVTMLTWCSQLRLPSGKSKGMLTGAHFFGLGARFVTSMDKVGTFINSGNAVGSVVRGTEKLTAAKWCAYTAPVEGKMVTFAIFDHPGNLRHPAQMFSMTAPFAFLSATLNLHKEPFALKEPLELRYGVALWDGAKSAEEIERVYQAWLQKNATRVALFCNHRF